jgi:hypothetical protein
MWQAEKWLIINDGQSTPIFFDGTSCRRSQPTETLLGTVSVAGVTPVIGDSVLLDLSADFLGVPNMLVRIRKSATDNTDLGFFQSLEAITSFNGYQAILTNNSQSGVTVGDQSVIYVPATAGSTNVVGVVNQVRSINGQNPAVSLNLQAPAPANISTGGSNRINFYGADGRLKFALDIPQFNWVPAPLSTTIQVWVTPSNYAYTTVIGDIIKTRFGVVTAPTPAYPVGTVSGAVTFAGGETKTIQLDAPYTGPDNQLVTINGQSFTMSKGTAPVVSHQVNLLNLTGTSTTAIPQNAIIVSVPELPPGRMGAYGLGRIWEVLTDGQSFLAGDIVNGSTGTPAFNRRDAVLHVTENNILAGGGNFRVPTSGEEIRAMIFSSNLDASLGQGPVLLFTKSKVFSCDASPDRTTWQTATQPILTQALISNGAEGQNSTLIVNGDTLFRSLDGIRSLIMARRDFDVWGNVPQSFEVEPTLALDDESLLQFGSGILFDNRVLMTASPQRSIYGIYHSKLIALNLDELSSLRGKAPAVYDGVWDGLNVLQIITGEFGGVQRAFAFCTSSDVSKIELWEVLVTGAATTDEGDTPIVWELESAALGFNEDKAKREDFRLLDGELRIDELFSDVTFETFYKPDQHPVWQAWHSWTERFKGQDVDPGFRSGLGLGEPDDKVFDKSDDSPMRELNTMQFRLRITGACRLLQARFKATTIPAVDFNPPAK